MVVRKLKALNAPDFWKVDKKKTTWVVSPRAGPHKKFESIPLAIILKNVLKIVETTKEAETVIKGGNVLVDNKIVKDPSYPAGLFDVISLPKNNKFYRIVPIKKGLNLIEVDQRESGVKICSIRNKTVVNKGKLQLNLNDGKNVLVESGEYVTGDSLLLDLPSLKILKHIKLKPGVVGIVVKGTDSGKTGVVKGISNGTISQTSKILCDLDGESEEVLKDRFFVIGEDRPLIKVRQ